MWNNKKPNNRSFWVFYQYPCIIHPPLCFQILGAPFFKEHLSVAVSTYKCRNVTPKTMKGNPKIIYTAQTEKFPIKDFFHAATSGQCYHYIETIRLICSVNGFYTMVTLLISDSTFSIYYFRLS